MNDETVRLVAVNPHDYKSTTVSLPKPPPDRSRFIILLVLVFVPFGGHFFKAAQSAMQPYFMASGLMDATKYGAMLSLFAVPNLVIPLLGGRVLDRGSRWTTLGFLGVSFAGMALYGLGLGVLRRVALGALGSAVFGVGEGCVVVAPRVYVSAAFLGRELAFAQGVLVAGSNLAGTLAKAAVPWIVERCGSRYEVALVVCCSVQLVSLAAGAVHASCFPPRARAEGVGAERGVAGPADDGSEAGVAGGDASGNASGDAGGGVRRAAMRASALLRPHLSSEFWFVAILHAMYVVVFKVFDNFSNSFLIERFGADPVEAGFMSSLTKIFALLAPAVGLVADCTGRVQPIVFGAAVLGAASLASLAFTSLSPVLGMLGMSLAHAFLPVLLHAVLPTTVPKSKFGIAFGISEVLVACGNVSSNPAIGYIRDASGNYDSAVVAFFGLALGGALMIGAGCGFRTQKPTSRPETGNSFSI